MRVISSLAVILFFFSTLLSIHGAPNRGYEKRTSSLVSRDGTDHNTVQFMAPKIKVEPPRNHRLILSYHANRVKARDNPTETKDFHYLTEGFKGAARHYN
ncbi:hypothetical protein OnM2_100008 [Erysiphe neolycopersici]|uniref:Secreted protein n=1 Tax=Erysiphe neolycopersici TaxID=212602 RepID=A0A420H987_9PEZI|nr:hypothetical protein OnM2_100008 [Erysiphe neolycopersici]